ncbi:MAG: hypothetical protein ACE5J9_06165 [Methanosarcinales archaeon]
MKDKLMTLTPDKWGLLEELSEDNLVNIQGVRAAAKTLPIKEWKLQRIISK